VYWILSSQCELYYWYLVGKGERSDSWEDWPASRWASEPIEIDPDQLKELLRKAGL
jgi:hypothetical protein